MSLILMGLSDDPVYEYIRKYSRIAISEMERSGVPASITLAQGILESNSGRSDLAVRGNNHFGIKCHNNWQGKTIRHNDDAKGECFRAYSDAEESFRDHSDFLRYSDRYKPLFELGPTDYKGWAEGLRKAGYATDPKYPEKLISLIERYELYRYDENTAPQVGPPLQVEQPVEISSSQRNSMAYKEKVNISLTRSIYEQNGVPFIYSVAGDSYSSLASSNGLFLKELLNFNDLKEERPLEPGTVVYLAGKKSQGPKDVPKYIVGSDSETLWDISQRFGIKLKSLEKLNPLLKNGLQQGDTVYLRK